MSRMVSEGGRLLVTTNCISMYPDSKFKPQAKPTTISEGWCHHLHQSQTNKGETSSQWIHRTRRVLIIILQLMPDRQSPPSLCTCRATPLVAALACFSSSSEASHLVLALDCLETLGLLLLTCLIRGGRLSEFFSTRTCRRRALHRRCRAPTSGARSALATG